MNHVVVLTFKILMPHHWPLYFWSGFKYLLHFSLPLWCIICLNNKVWLKVCLTGFFSHFQFLPFNFPPSFVCLVPSYDCNFLCGDNCGKIEMQPSICCKNLSQSPSISAHQLREAHARLRIHVRRETKKSIPPGNRVIIVIMKREYLYYTRMTRPTRFFLLARWKWV